MYARKLIALSASVVLAFSLSACNRESSGTSADGGSADGSITLALSTQTNPFFVQLRDGAQEKADELGVTLNVQDASDDAATQANQLNNAVTTGAGVVIVNPTDSDAVVPSVEALNQADIPVVAVDRSSNGGEVASFVASDNVAGGAQAAAAWQRRSVAKVKSSCCKALRDPLHHVIVDRDLKRRSLSMRAFPLWLSRPPTLTAVRAWTWQLTCCRHTPM